jgi:hypothetical protein
MTEHFEPSHIQKLGGYLANVQDGPSLQVHVQGSYEWIGGHDVYAMKYLRTLCVAPPNLAFSFCGVMRCQFVQTVAKWHDYCLLGRW